MLKETVENETYLGIEIVRFFFKCKNCFSFIAFKTDPKNHDYIVENGGRRKYDAYRDAEAAEEVLKNLRV